MKSFEVRLMQTNTHKLVINAPDRAALENWLSVVEHRQEALECSDVVANSVPTAVVGVEISFDAWAELEVPA